MTPTANRLGLCLALAVMLGATSDAAASSPLVTPVFVAVSSIGQLPGRRAPAERRKGEDLLKEARRVMQEGKFDLAERYIQQAEQLNVNQEFWFSPFVDTPQKVRKDLEKLKSENLVSPRRPSSRFLPSLLGNEEVHNENSVRQVPADPFRVRTSDQIVDELAQNAKAQAGTYLQKSRQALAEQNVAGALGWYQKALALNVTYAPGEYSIQQLEGELQQAGVDVAFVKRQSARTAPVPGARTPEPPQVAANPVPSGNQPSTVVTHRDGQRAGGLPRALSGPVRSQAAPGQSLPAGQRPLSRPAPRQNPPQRMAQVQTILGKARAALDHGDVEQAQRLANQARGLNVPESAYAEGDVRPWMILMEIDKARGRQVAGVRLAEGAGSPGATASRPATSRYDVARTYYEPHKDTTRTIPASRSQEAEPVVDGGRQGQELFRKGEQALMGRDQDAARRLFQQAWKYEAWLDGVTRQKLQDHLQGLSAPRAPGPAPRIENAAPLGGAVSPQTILMRQLVNDVGQKQREAERIGQTDPIGALQELKSVRERVEQSELESPARKQLLTRVDLSISRLEKFIDDNRHQIELDTRNREVLEQIDRERRVRLETQDKLSVLIEEFNQLIDQRRYSEAVTLARKVEKLDPENPVTENLLWKSKFIRNFQRQMDLREQSEEGVIGQLSSIQESAIPFDDREPYRLPDTPDWKQLTERRGRLLRDRRTRLTEAELDIQKRLKQQVEVLFDRQPLAQVMDTLGRMSGINVYLDPEGLAAEGITSDHPIDITLTRPVSLRSALALILHPLRLSFVIQNEVLKITSEQTRDTDVYTRVYNVADLVIPIPNFMPSYNIGLPAALAAAHNAIRPGGMGSQAFETPIAMVAQNRNTGAVPEKASVLAQLGAAGIIPQHTRQPTGYGPVGLGAGTQPDFDSLIELITATVSPTTWDEVGGPGSVTGFDGNLSLVISQTQDVHKEIVDLLQQLRRLQDLQVTIEVRFIRLSDNFFERLGVDFDFNIEDNSSLDIAQEDFTGPSTSHGLDPVGQPTADLDFRFRQGSFAATVPAFGGFDANSAATFGFAILSDIETFFLIQAAQGDRRSNVLQAPKVTLFNGQTASISDTTQRPFVTSVTPVVGDFAAAQQPVIVVLNEGMSLSVQAVVSPDRRFVRLTLVPFFGQIGEVEEFTFTGRTTSNSGTYAVDPSDAGQNIQNMEERVVEGTTVQLPEFSFQTVTTTVSVPDGGTVLLGGIKRLSEGRDEEGVPILSKLPYINRLFSNVGIGRSATSLMFVVTPRIIIQEEEEELATGTPP